MTADQEKKLQQALRHRGKIEAIAKANGLDPDLVTALVAQESAGDEHCEPRREPKFEYFWPPHDTVAQTALAEKLGHSLEDELEFQRCSHGLMQLMGANFRALGFMGKREDIIAEVGLTFSCRFLKAYVHRWPEETDWIAAYNQGSPRKTPGGLYENQKGYVDPVCGYLRELRKLA